MKVGHAYKIRLALKFDEDIDTIVKKYRWEYTEEEIRAFIASCPESKTEPPKNPEPEAIKKRSRAPKEVTSVVPGLNL